MGGTWRNFFALVVIIAIVAAAYFTFLVPEQEPPLQIDFDSGYEEIKGIWTENGFDEGYLALDEMAFVDYATGSQLSSLEASLESYNAEISGKNQALESLAGIYLDSARLFSEYSSLSSELGSESALAPEDICGQLTQTRTEEAEVMDYLDSAIALAGKISNFKQNYPSEAVKAGLSGSAFNESELNQAKSELAGAISNLEDFCEA